MDKEEIRIKILAEIAKTEKRILQCREMSEPVAPDVAIGRISRMDAINNKSVVEAALRKAEEKLKKLQEALNMLDKPEFGICLQCKETIPLARILIKPESAYCVKCAL